MKSIFIQIFVFSSTRNSLTTPIENQSYNNIESEMLKKLFENSISILACIKRVDNKIDSIIQMNNNFQTNYTAVNNDLENMFPLKTVEAVEDIECKLSTDENLLVQMVLTNYNIVYILLHKWL